MSSGRRGEELAVRGHAELGGRGHGNLLRHVGIAEALRPDEVLVGYDADDDPRESAVGDLALEPRREEALGAQDVGIGRGRRRLGAGRRGDEKGYSAVRSQGSHAILISWVGYRKVVGEDTAIVLDAPLTRWGKVRGNSHGATPCDTSSRSRSPSC